MSAGAMGLAYEQPNGALVPWGGDLRHRQGDLSGGTDLYDCRTAWAAYGKTLTIKSGMGWDDVVKAHDEGRAIVVQGTGNVPGSSSFDEPHACVISPETHSGGDWLFGDPNTTGWQWVSPSSIKTWMAAFSSGYAFAVGTRPPAPVPPEPPEPEPKPPQPPQPPPPPLVDPAPRVPSSWASPGAGVWPAPVMRWALTWGSASWGRDAWPA